MGVPDLSIVQFNFEVSLIVSKVFYNYSVILDQERDDDKTCSVKSQLVF